MPLSYVQYKGDGVTDTLNIPFPYISASHIQVKINGSLDSGITFPTAFTVKTVTVPTSGAIVEVRRVTPNTSALVDFEDGSLLSENDLDLLALQTLYVMQQYPALVVTNQRVIPGCRRSKKKGGFPLPSFSLVHALRQ